MADSRDLKLVKGAHEVHQTNPFLDLLHIKPGQREQGSNLARKLQELVDRKIIPVDQLSDVVAEHEDGCALMAAQGGVCNCDVEIYDAKGERLA